MASRQLSSLSLKSSDMPNQDGSPLRKLKPEAYSSRASISKTGVPGSVFDSLKGAIELSIATARVRKLSDNTTEIGNNSVGNLPQLKDSSDVLSRYFDFGHKDIRRMASPEAKLGPKPKLIFPGRQDAVKSILTKLQETSNHLLSDHAEKNTASHIIDLHE